MLTRPCSGFNHEDHWGHRAGEPNKAVICSIALARLRTDIKGNDLANSNAVGMAQKLLLFWRKPARRCWWEGVELDNVKGVEGKLKVWIRRVWTLEMVREVSRPYILTNINAERHRTPLTHTVPRFFCCTGFLVHALLQVERPSICLHSPCFLVHSKSTLFN